MQKEVPEKLRQEFLRKHKTEDEAALAGKHIIEHIKDAEQKIDDNVAYVQQAIAKVGPRRGFE